MFKTLKGIALSLEIIANRLPEIKEAIYKEKEEGEEGEKKLWDTVGAVQGITLVNSGYGGGSIDGEIEFCIDDKSMKFDYRDGHTFRSDLMVPCLLVEGLKETKIRYTKRENLSKKEEKMFKERGFVIVL